MSKEHAALEAEFCLRCQDAALGQLPEATTEIAFFECPSCHRHYAKREGRSLTYRWLHPISIALYEFSFRSEPKEGFASSAARAIAEERSTEEIKFVVSEIEADLIRPTQQVRDILGTQASEEVCRQFLSSVIELIRSKLQQ